jgi:hypothetical protein
VFILHVLTTSHEIVEQCNLSWVARQFDFVSFVVSDKRSGRGYQNSVSDLLD